MITLSIILVTGLVYWDLAGFRRNGADVRVIRTPLFFGIFTQLLIIVGLTAEAILFTSPFMEVVGGFVISDFFSPENRYELFRVFIGLIVSLSVYWFYRRRYRSSPIGITPREIKLKEIALLIAVTLGIVTGIALLFVQFGGGVGF